MLIKRDIFYFSGSYRECFSRSYKLGIRSRPIKLTPTCELQRTQRDPSSSIRACLCTTSNCNILDSENAQFRNTSSNAKTKVVGKILHYIAFQSVFICLSIKLVDAQHIKLTSFSDDEIFHTWPFEFHFNYKVLSILTYSYLTLILTGHQF